MVPPPSIRRYPPRPLDCALAGPRGRSVAPCLRTAAATSRRLRERLQNLRYGKIRPPPSAGLGAGAPERLVGRGRPREMGARAQEVLVRHRVEVGLVRDRPGVRLE